MLDEAFARRRMVLCSLDYMYKNQQCVCFFEKLRCKGFLRKFMGIAYCVKTFCLLVCFVKQSDEVQV